MERGEVIQIGLLIATFLAVLVALFGERFWKWLDRRKRREKIKKLLLHHLKQIQEDFARIKEERTPSEEIEKGKVIFSEVSFNEINGWLFLYDHILLRFIDDLDITKLSNTIDFFHHYKIQLHNIESRLKESENREGWITLGTFNKLMEYLSKSISELSQV